ncbi:MAG: helix-turn-helix domain-containing protein [Pseudomonadota bacterium]
MANATPLKAYLEAPDSKSDGQVETRGQPRRALRLDTSGSSPSGEYANVTIHNISAAGLLIETDMLLRVGEILSLDLPERGGVGAEVVWQSGKLFGCAFEQALGEAALAAAQLRGAPPVITPTEKPAVSFGGGVGASLGVKLNRLRRERGLTLAQVADALGVSKPTVWAWEKGKARPLAERIEAIADVLGVPATEFTESSDSAASSVLVAECRERLAQAYGISPQSIRIMIEV